MLPLCITPRGRTFLLITLFSRKNASIMLHPRGRSFLLITLFSWKNASVMLRKNDSIVNISQSIVCTICCVSRVIVSELLITLYTSLNQFEPVLSRLCYISLLATLYSQSGYDCMYYRAVLVTQDGLQLRTL